MKSWKTRTGSADDRTVTALVRRIRFVRAAARREDDRRGRRDVLGPVVLTDAEDIEPDLIGELDFFQEVVEALPSRAVRAVCRCGRGFYEREKADFHSAL